MAPNTSHIQYIHTHGLQDHPWELTWPCPLPLSAGVCPEQTGPLRREQWRPEAVLLSRRRGGGRMPVVSRCRSFWEWCHTHRNPHPHTSQLLGSGLCAEVEKEQHSYDQAAGFAVMDELTLATIQTRGELGPWARPLTFGLSLWSHSLSIDQHRAAHSLCTQSHKQSLETLWGSTKARVMTGRRVTSSGRMDW